MKLVSDTKSKKAKKKGKCNRIVALLDNEVMMIETEQLGKQFMKRVVKSRRKKQDWHIDCYREKL